MSRVDVRPLSLLVLGLVLGLVGCDEHGALPVTYDPMMPPTLAEVSAAPASVGPGEVLRLGVTASVSHGTLSFSWTTSAGTVSTPVSDAGSSEAVWTSPSCLPAGVTPTVTVTVSRGPGLNASHTFPVTWTGPACTRPPCSFSLEAGRLALAADCTTDLTLLIPDGYTFDGEGHTVTAVDPPEGRFSGAVLRNRGGTVRVRDVTVTASGLRDSCLSGAAMLRGILLDGASGEVVDSVVSGLGKGPTSGCQEGFGIEVRNDDASRGPFRVDVLRNRVSDFQKTGILATGAVEVTLADNTVEGGGPVSHIARNGIQVSNGVTARVTGNRVSGNAYTGAGVASATGVLLQVGPGEALVAGLVVEGNTLTGNDIGIYLYQDAGDPPAPAARSRIANNVLQNDAVSNRTYQAAIADYYGTGSVITSNQLSGAGYDPRTVPDRTFDVSVYTLQPASRLTFLTSGYDLAAGACSSKVTVQSQDAAGNLVPSAGSFQLGASGTAAAGVTFHADPGCTGAPLTTVDLSNAQAEATFYFKSSQPGAATVVVSGGSLTSASQAQSIH